MRGPGDDEATTPSAAAVPPVPAVVEVATPPRGGSYFELADSRAGDDATHVALSADAYRLHLYALTDAVIAGHEGLVTATYLRERSVEETQVRELCSAGLWAPAEGGYRIVDQPTLQAVRATYEDARRVAAECLGGLGHVIDHANPGTCAVCHSPIGELPEPRSG